MKKTLVTLIAASVVGAVVLGWLVFQNRSVSAPPKTTPPVSNNQNQPDPNKHDFSDVDFSRKMIVHNQQAIEMTEAVLAVSTNQVVREIATKIQQEQKAPKINIRAGWASGTKHTRICLIFLKWTVMTCTLLFLASRQQQTWQRLKLQPVVTQTGFSLV